MSASTPRESLEAADGGFRLRCKVIPRAKRTGWGEIRDGRVMVRLTAPATDGKANLALKKFVSAQFGTAPGRVTIEKGQTSRLKMIRIDKPSRIPDIWQPADEPK